MEMGVEFSKLLQLNGCLDAQVPAQPGLQRLPRRGHRIRQWAEKVCSGGVKAESRIQAGWYMLARVLPKEK